MKKKSVKEQILEITGMTEEEFYKNYPLESDKSKLIAKYGKKVEKLLNGGAVKKAQIGTFTGGKQSTYTPVNYGDIYDKVDYSVTGSNRQMRMQDANLAAQQTIAQNSKKNGLFDMLSQLAPGLDALSNVGGGETEPNVATETVDISNINMRYGGRIHRADNGFVQKMTNFSNTVGQKIGKGFDQADSSLGKVGGVSGAIGIGGDLLQGINMIKAEQAQSKIAQQSFDLSNLTRKASQLTPDITERNYVRPEQQIINPDELNRQLGIGTNILSAYNGARFSPGEIQNVYNPGDIYSDSGYEPLEDSKKYKKGGKIKKAQFGFDKMAGEAGNALGSLIGGGKGKSTGAGKIGSVVGSTVGKFVPIPGADIVLSGVGGLVGGIIGGKDAAKTASNLAGAERNLTGQTFETGVRSVLGQNSAFAENGGNFQPQVATELEGIPLTKLFAPDPTMHTLRTGGHVRQNNISAMDGNIKATWGGQLQPISYNPYQAGSGQTVLGFGNYHDQEDENGRTGIGLSVGNKNSNPMMDYAEYGTKAAEENSNVEIQPKEPIIEQRNLNGSTSVVVLGNQKLTRETAKIMGNPKLAGKKINNVGLDIAMDERKINDKMQKSAAFLAELNANNPYDKLTQSGLKASFEGYNRQLQKLADDKLKLTAIQDKINELDESGVDYKKYIDKGEVIKNTNKAKMGGKITTAQKGVTKEQQTEGERLYKSGDIKGFQEYVQKVAPWIVDEIIKEKGLPKISKTWADNLKGPRTDDAFQRFIDPTILNTFSQASSSSDQPSGKSIADIQSGIASQMDTLEPTYAEQYTGNFPERPIADRNKNWLLQAFNQIRPYIIPSNAEALDPSQISGEMMALSDNEIRPVRVQSFQSQLATPYTVSFQDKINEITSGQRAATRLAGYNPAAQSIIAAAAAREKSGILGEELRTNLALQNEIYNRNRDLINADRLRNMELYDQQFVRQEQAIANTKAVKQAALNSINAKILQNRLANKQAGLMQNLYGYRFDEEGRAINYNPLATFNIEGSGDMSGTPGIGGMNLEDLEYLVAKKKYEEKQQKKLTKDARNGAIVLATKKSNYNK